MSKNSQAYAYPHLIGWKQKVWCLEVGDVLVHNDIRYTITRVYPALQPGSFPEFDVEKLSDDQ